MQKVRQFWPELIVSFFVFRDIPRKKFHLEGQSFHVQFCDG
jgi:hypothetical protein